YNEVNESSTKDKGKGKMVYEEDKIETEEERQVRNSFNEKEKEETKTIESNFKDQTYERAKQEQANYDQNWRNERYEQHAQ
ncbi:6525_t:CDS:2, partial [Scutellospora calospora]